MQQIWILPALLSAFALATSDALTKKALARNNEYLVALFRLIFSLPFLLCIFVFIPVPNLDRKFYAAFAVAVPFEITAWIFYIRALRISPMSLTLPFLSLTPVVLIGVSYAMLGERVSLQGGIGIGCLAAGGYFLHFHKMKRSIFEPFRAIAKEKGSVLMIVTALIYSMTSTLGKMAIIHSSPLFFGLLYFIVITALFAPIALWSGRNELKNFLREKHFKVLILPGFFHAVMIVAHMTAISMTKVAYMISLKRTSLLISIVYGYFLFGERHIRERFTGALLMFSGFVLIVTAA
jgi:drug/metabolite transporter (DMT)-like permease